MRKCITCGFELGDEEQYCGNCGTKAPNGAVDTRPDEINLLKDNKNPKYFNYNLKWHWWVTRVFLILSVIFSIIYAFQFVFDNSIDKRLNMIPTATIKTVCISYGLLYIGKGAFALVVRKLLMDYRESGPRSYYAYIMASGIFETIINCTFVSISTFTDFIILVGIIIMKLLPYIIYLILMVIYYSKRKPAFEY